MAFLEITKWKAKVIFNTSTEAALQAILKKARSTAMVNGTIWTNADMKVTGCKVRDTVKAFLQTTKAKNFTKIS